MGYTTVTDDFGTYFYGDKGNLIAYKGHNAPSSPELQFALDNA